MVTATLLLNILVLIPICLGLLLKVSHFDKVFGVDSTARQVLSSIYLAILVFSLAILIFPGKTSVLLVPILSLQIFYKLTSVLLIKDKKNPVLWFNLIISAFHSLTLYFVFSDNS